MNIRRLLAAGLLLVPLALLTTACGGVVNPQGWASPAVDGQNLFVFEKKDRVNAIEPDSAGGFRLRWTFPDHNQGPQKDIDLRAVYGAPVVDGDTVYVAGYDQGLFAVNEADGALLRRFKTGDHVAGGVSVDGDQVAFATVEGHLFLLNKKDFSPAEAWDDGGVKFKEGIWSTPVLNGNSVYVPTIDGKVWSVDRATGDIKWSFSTGGGAVATVTDLDDTRLFVPSLNKNVYILDKSTGEVLSTFRATDWVYTEPVVKDNVAYFGDFKGNVFALDIITGQEKWSAPYDAGDEVKGGPAIVGDVLVVGTSGGVLHFIQLDSGHGISTVSLDVVANGDAGSLRANLVADGQQVLAGTTKGRLFAAQPTTTPPTVTEVPLGGDG